MIEIQQSIWANTREIKRRTAGNNYPTELRERVAGKGRARRKWRNSRLLAHKTNLNQLTQQLRREIRKIKRGSIKRYLSKLTYEKDSEYSLWKSTKRITRPGNQIPPLWKNCDTWK